MMEFKTPWALALVPVVLFVFWYVRRRQQAAAYPFPSTGLIGKGTGSWKVRLVWVLALLRVLALVLVCVALAGPRKVLQESRVITHGIDIVLALDCSGSMGAEDFMLEGRRWSRLDIIKKVVADFINGRRNDQMALVAFAGKAYTVCPLTMDHDWLQENLKRMQLGLIEDGTAIGSGIATSLSRFKDSTAKSKIIILLTDGVNNAGNMDPVTAAKAAAALGVKIYTIGAGSKGPAPYPVQTVFGQTMYQMIQSDLDEGTLQNIAKLTNGRYFRAADTDALKDIYKTIDSLEKSKIEKTGYKEYEPLFWVFLTAALLLLVLELALANSVFFKVP